jgi:hypothetical protein
MLGVLVYPHRHKGTAMSYQITFETPNKKFDLEIYDTAGRLVYAKRGYSNENSLNQALQSTKIEREGIFNAELTRLFSGGSLLAEVTGADAVVSGEETLI